MACRRLACRKTLHSIASTNEFRRSPANTGSPNCIILNGLIGTISVGMRAGRGAFITRRIAAFNPVTPAGNHQLRTVAPAQARSHRNFLIALEE
jgi:hypothetical protein